MRVAVWGLWLWCAVVSTCSVAAAERVREGLLALYEFREGAGDLLHDTSGAGTPLELKIGSPSSVEWGNGFLAIRSSASIVSQGPATKIVEAARAHHGLTLEAWLKPASDSQSGPARIVSLSLSPSLRNLTLGQDGAKFDCRLRTTATDENGIPSTTTAAGPARAELTHVAVTRAPLGQTVIYVNGRPAATSLIDGKLSNWTSTPLSLANELTGDRPWLGELHMVAFYQRALDAAEVERNFSAGPPAAIDYDALLPPAADRTIDFVTDVQPILRERCFECHAEGNEEGGLNLSIRARVMEGGEHGPVLRPGQGTASRLIHFVAGLDKKKIMPPDGERLTAEQIGLLRAWIDQGAKWPAGADVLDPRTERAKAHWAFQPLAQLPQLAPPQVRHDAWCRTDVDRFLLATLEARGLAPNPPADAAALVRRLWFDVVGLPPSPDEMVQWTKRCAEDPRGVTELVDHLLGSVHYGERWARHWLDVARYADSDGQEGDRDRPQAWRYRDFVIQALNDDMPYDAFVRWQLAGDEFEPQNSLALAATGFLTAGPNTVLENTFLEEERLRNRYNELDDMLATMGTAMLGLSIGCARCHDHKYDAISAREYYRLLSVLHSGDRKEVPHPAGEGDILAFQDFGAEPATTWLFRRGDFYDRAQQVQLGFPAVLLRGATAESYWAAARAERPLSDSTYQRKALALWMTDVEGGAGALLARVIVNRVWQHHFGEGLVRTVSDFGVRGESPSHPELLEWLAADFVQHGWRLKRLHQLVLTSAAYGQSSQFDANKAADDPENRLLWRMTPRRIEAELLRDAMLAVSGVLNRTPYGPAFKPPISPEAMIARNLKTPYPKDVVEGPDTLRRTIYMFHKRVIPYPLLQAFDRPDSLQSCGRRDNTIVAPQALALLNDPFVRSRARDFAQRLREENREAFDREDWESIVVPAFQRAMARAPRPSEQAASRQFVAQQVERRRNESPQSPQEDVRLDALSDFCQALFGLNEFIHVD